MAKRTLTASELRRLAEAADGIRDQAAYVVWGAHGPEVKTKLGKGDELIVECDTRSQVADRPEFQAITLDPPMVDSAGNPVSHVQSKYDAMFWSEASVEKFVIPYYSRFMTPHHLVRIMAAFNHPATTAMIHPPLSEIQFLTSVRTAKAGQKGVEVMGLKEFEAAL
jgi:hypothetical protein